MEDRSIRLDGKPDAALHISTFFPAPSSCEPFTHTLVVFLNGLALPRSSWKAAVDHFIDLRQQTGKPIPSLVSYDRYGQGDSDPDPTDDAGQLPYGHDPHAVTADLHRLLLHLCEHDDHLKIPSIEDMSIVFVCNSIGCALARLYAQEHPGLVAGYLFLDSMMANTDFVSLFPDPDEPGFDEKKLPTGVTADGLRHAREMCAKMFHPTVPNGEHLDRRKLPDVLPYADRPALPPGPNGKAPRLVVVGHDWDEFAKQCENGHMDVPKAVINAYMNPAWGAYNEGLTRLTENPGRDGKKEDVKIANGCGHFIQRDDPIFVATEIGSLLEDLAREQLESTGRNESVSEL
ncbi:Alpha/beta hydrolase fold-1 [Diplogelasinospora grovesii]|uniref:Alpha/beta hydrolase fold-1 n=1 Tax=Diplogelasinospora grovesii TaxID=303347 RepID=A0AAN6NFT9_9PEZI|nr:Alpha/beta hydrolase fold-1 [Diplogelasinospora grovesii]